MDIYLKVETTIGVYHANFLNGSFSFNFYISHSKALRGGTQLCLFGFREHTQHAVVENVD